MDSDIDILERFENVDECEERDDHEEGDFEWEEPTLASIKLMEERRDAIRDQLASQRCH